MASMVGYEGFLLMSSPPSVNLPANFALQDSGDHQTFQPSTVNAAYRYFDKGASFTVQAEYDDIQTVTITGSPTGGTFSLTFGGQTTSGIAYNALASAVQSALVALSSIGNGNVSVTGNAGGPYTVEFTGTLGYAAQTLMTGNGAGLTGGSSPGVSLAHTQTGITWTTQSAYTLQYVGGKVKFTNPLSGTPDVRVTVGKYYPYAVLANITKWTFNGERLFQDATVMTATATTPGHAGKVYAPLQLQGTFTVEKFWVPETSEGYAADLTAGTLLIISGVDRLSGHRYEGYAYASKLTLNVDNGKLVDSPLEFQFTDDLFAV